MSLIFFVHSYEFFSFKFGTWKDNWQLTFQVCNRPNKTKENTSQHSSLVDYFAQVIYAKKLSHQFLLYFPIGMGSYDHHAYYQGVFP